MKSERYYIETVMDIIDQLSASDLHDKIQENPLDNSLFNTIFFYPMSVANAILILAELGINEHTPKNYKTVNGDYFSGIISRNLYMEQSYEFPLSEV